MEISAFHGNLHVPWILSAFRGNIHVPCLLSAFCGYIYVLRGYYPHSVEISMFRVYYPHFVEISTSCVYYPHFLDITAFFGYDPHFVVIILIGCITSYLARNVRHGLCSFVLVVDVIYIDHITSYLARNNRPIFYIYSFSESDWCNGVIYVPYKIGTNFFITIQLPMKIFQSPCPCWLIKDPVWLVWRSVLSKHDHLIAISSDLIAIVNNNPCSVPARLVFSNWSFVDFWVVYLPILVERDGVDRLSM